MKRIILLFLGISFFAGCSEDDDNIDSLVGIWISQGNVAREVFLCNEPTDNFTTPRSCTSQSCYKLELNADGSYSFQRGTLVERGTYSSDGRSISLCFDEEGEQVCQTFATEVTSVTLTLTTTDEVTGCETNDYFFREETPEEA